MAEKSNKKRQRTSRKSSGARARSKTRHLTKTLEKGFERRVARLRKLWKDLNEVRAQTTDEDPKAGQRRFERERRTTHDIVRARFNTCANRKSAERLFESAGVPLASHRPRATPKLDTQAAG